MTDPVMITLIICFTVIFISLIIAVVIRWICIVTLNNRQQKSDDEYLTIDEFQEFEQIVANAIHDLDDKIGGDKNGKD